MALCSLFLFLFCLIQLTGRSSANTPTAAPSYASGTCVGSGSSNQCGNAGLSGSCYCDEQCCSYGDCCSDKYTTCGGCALANTPTMTPTAAPSRDPTQAPTQSPTAPPTWAPTQPPTTPPTTSPTTPPTEAPTFSPTKAPTASPTLAPTAVPSAAPTTSPTDAPCGCVAFKDGDCYFNWKRIKKMLIYNRYCWLFVKYINNFIDVKGNISDLATCSTF